MQFLNHARGSLYELQTQVKIARRLNYLNIDAASALDSEAAQVGRLLNGLIRKFRTSPANPEPKA
jgi:four helix bundle protein